MEIEETPDADVPAAETATGTPASTASRASRRVRAPAVKKDEVAAAKRPARVAKEKIEEKEAGKRKIEKEGMKRTGKKIKTDEDETDGDGSDAVEAAEPPAPLTAGPPAATATASTATTSVTILVYFWSLQTTKTFEKYTTRIQQDSNTQLPGCVSAQLTTRPRVPIHYLNIITKMDDP